MSNAISIPHIYVINLESRPDRLERMQRRLQYHNLLSHSTIIKAVTTTDPVVDEYYGKMIDTNYKPHGDHVASIRGHIACLASHLKALRQMIADNYEEAIILEDDAMLHNDFMNKYQQCRQNIAESAISHNSPFTILLLFYNIADINESQREWVGINPEKRNVFKMQSKNMDSAVGYVISRQHAAQCLINYDKPFIEYDITNKYNITSEYIIRFTDGLLLHPVLAIEEPMVTSNLRDNAIYGEKASQHLDWNEYTAAETNSWRLLLEGRKHHVAYNHQKAYEVMKDIRLDELSSYHQYIYIDIALTSFWYANQREKVKELVYILRNLYKNDIVIRKNMDANYTRIMNNVKFYVPEIEF